MQKFQDTFETRKRSFIDVFQLHDCKFEYERLYSNINKNFI